MTEKFFQTTFLFLFISNHGAYAVWNWKDHKPEFVTGDQRNKYHHFWPSQLFYNCLRSLYGRRLSKKRRICIRWTESMRWRKTACRRCQGKKKGGRHEKKEPGKLEVTQVKRVRRGREKGRDRQREAGRRSLSFHLQSNLSYSKDSKLPNDLSFSKPTDKL